MRSCLATALLAACSFREGAIGDGGSPDSPPVFDDAGHEIRTWTIDQASDFAKGTSFVEVGIDPWGSLTPAGYFYGGFMICGVDGAALWHQSDPDPVSFSPAQGVTPNGAARWFAQDIDFLYSQTRYFGVTQQTFSAWVVGEIYLQQGNGHGFQLTGGDVAFLQIAVPGTDSYQTFPAARGNTQYLTFNAPVTGWYPIRIGWANSSTGYALHLLHASPGQLSYRHLGPTEIRGRADGPRGLLQQVFDHQVLAATVNLDAVYPRPKLLPDDAIAPSYFVNQLEGEPNSGPWSGRWAGQFYANVAGIYTLQATSSDGNALAVAGQGSGSNFAVGAVGSSTSSVTATLVQGWNDLWVDYNRVSSSPNLTLEVTSGPDSTLIGKALPLSQLRAVEPPADRLLVVTALPQATIPDNNPSGTSLQLSFPGLSGQTLSSLALHVSVTNPELDAITITLTNPVGASYTLVTNGAAGTGTRTYDFVLDHGNRSAWFPGVFATSSTWTLNVSDNRSTSMGMTGTLNEVSMTMHSAGGPDEIARDSIWSSEIVDNVTTVASVDMITWKENSLGMPAIVRMRACDASCTNEPWTKLSNGVTPPQSLAGHRYLQSQVEFTSDGFHSPEFQQLVIVYRRNVH